MQDYRNSNRLSVKTVLSFVLVLILAYLPVSLFLYFIKNDAFSGYFPPKFFMTVSLHAGHLPLWNPYINYGIPQYGDMSSGYWSPITWIIASTVGYNAYTFTLEVLLYILVGGIGMYKLTGYWKLNKNVRYIAAIAFMCCGYNVGHLQHFNWLSGAAFLPWCTWGYLLLQSELSLKNILKSALIFYLFISSAHPGLIIGGFYFFLALSLFLFFKNENRVYFSKKAKQYFVGHSLLLLILLILGAGLVTGYLDIFPYFSRADSLPGTAFKDPTSFQSWISFVFPLSTSKNDPFFGTDISMRNIYFSLVLFLFFVFSLFQRKDSWQRFFLLTGLIFLLLSAQIFGNFLPFIGYVRLGGEFAIFAMASFIIVAAIQLDRFFTSGNFKGNIRYVYYFFEAILFICIIWGLYKTFSTKESFIYSFKNIFLQSGITQKLKVFIDSVSFYDAFWLQGIFQMLILWGIKWCLRERSLSLLTRIVIADLIIATLLNLPFTGVGKASVDDVQKVLDKAPSGIPIPALQPVVRNDSVSLYEKGLVGDWSFYNKQIGVTQLKPYPVILKNIEKYFDSSKAELVQNDFLFSTNPNVKPFINYFDGHQIMFQVSSPDTGRIIFQQVFYPHWFSNDVPVKEYGPFMNASLVKGNNNIEFSFRPQLVKVAMIISLASFILIIFLLILNPWFIRRQIL